TAPERTEDLIVVSFWTIVSIYGWITNTIVMISILTTVDLRKSSCEQAREFARVQIITNYLRLLCIAFPLGYSTFFTLKRTISLASSCLACGAGAATVNLLPCCRAYTDPVTYTTVYPEDSWFTEYDLSLVLTFCTCSVFVYVLILHFIRRHARKLKHSALSPIDKSRASNRRTEIILTIQCAVICGFNIGASTSWDIVPMISDTKMTFIVLNSLFLLNNCTSSTVHLLTNSRLRAEVGRSLRFNASDSSFFTKIVARRNPNSS
ncbi:hypothetical protein PRIPAC_79162, partial [Pristionchus pacificus]|uniref:G protein-coupled receptor n=1 Tax=Pristionchus pacificus TaxID=54126 RepID=A0A2A6C339_PRIPA